MKVAIYPGTFDPVTNGHLDVIKRGSKLFDRIVVAVASNHSKKPLFNLEQRLEVLSMVLKPYPQVSVAVVEGLLVDFAKQHQAQVILRGIRSASDCDYELQMAGMNQALNIDVETLFLAPSEHYRFISSTLVREIVSLKGDVSRFVPPAVVKFLEDHAKR